MRDDASVPVAIRRGTAFVLVEGTAVGDPVEIENVVIIPVYGEPVGTRDVVDFWVATYEGGDLPLDGPVDLLVVEMGSQPRVHGFAGVAANGARSFRFQGSPGGFAYGWQTLDTADLVAVMRERLPMVVGDLSTAAAPYRP